MNEGNGKLNRGNNGNPSTKSTAIKILNVGEVISVTDPNYLGRIKVRIRADRTNGGDNGVSDENLPWCLPLIPKFLSIQPKIKEAVYVFTFGTDKQFIDRMYVGPIISQPQKLPFDSHYMSALAGFSFDSTAPGISIDTIPQLKGIFPKPEDISIQGRYNTDITQKNNEIILRAGKFVESKGNVTKSDFSFNDTNTQFQNQSFPFEYNLKTQAYIQIKNDVTIFTDVLNNTTKNGTVTNIVASKINLLTHEDGNPRFDLTNQDNLISDSELNLILTEAHQLPFGDVLIEYLRLLKFAFLGHVHNGSGRVPTDLTTNGQMSVKIFTERANALESQMLSKNIRIN